MPSNSIESNSATAFERRDPVTDAVEPVGRTVTTANARPVNEIDDRDLGVHCEGRHPSM